MNKMKENGKIKVVIAINDFVVGGGQRLLVDIFRFIDKNKFDISLVTLFQFENKWEFYGFIPDCVKVYKLNFSNFWSIREWLKLAKIIKNIKPEIVISNIFFTNTVLRVLKIFLKYKIIIVEHNTYIYKTRIQILIDRILSYVTDKIVAVSKTVASFTANQEKINPDKFSVIYNGIDIDNIKKAVEKFDRNKILNELGFLDSDKIIINVARLVPQKNHKSLIDAFYEFSKKHNAYKLIIISEGSLKRELEEQIEKFYLKNKVFLLGNRENVFDYYLISDFFVSTSFIEGFSLAHAEAMACGLPILSTKTAGSDEMIEEGINGYFIKGSDSVSIIRGLKKMASSNLENMSRNSLEIVKKFSIIETVKNYERLISDIYYGKT